MPFTPLVAIHLFAALAALAIGPVALWARRGRRQRPRLHRAFGYAWVTLMVATALSALLIRDTHFPNIGGFTAIHLLVPLTLAGLFASFRALARGDIARHRRLMQQLYLGGCVVAGLFTLLPDRLLGKLVLVQWLGLDAATRTRLWSMAAAIVSHTPGVVWVLLAALVALGLTQARERRVGLARATALPVAMVALSLWTTASLFARGSLLPMVLGAWLAAAAAAFLPVARSAAPRGTRFDPAGRQFIVPGSWWPMLLIVGIFLLRYAANVALAIRPGLATDTAFAIAAASFAGAFTGAFAGRVARLWPLVQRQPSAFTARSLA